MPTTHRGPSDGVVSRVAPALNPAWSYQTFGYTDFHTWPFGTSPTYSVDGNGLHASADVSLRVPLTLPQGAVVREVTFWVYNASASTGLGVGLAVLTPPSTFTGGNFAFTDPGAGSHTVTIDTDFIGSPVDNTVRGYSLSAFLTGGGTHGLSGARIGYENGLVLTNVAPARKLDTRKAGPLKGKIATGKTKTFSLTPELPAGVAKTALVNLTAIETEGGGALAVFAAGGAEPGTPSVSWRGAGDALTNTTVVPVSPTGEVSVSCGGHKGARTHVVVDLLGYYA